MVSEMTANEKDQFIPKMKKSMMFRYLEEHALRDILSVADVMCLEEGERIITEGEVSPYFYLVLSGCVNVLVNEAEGKEVFISAIGEGECFGEAGIFLTMKRTAHVVSTENTTVLRMHREKLLQFIKRQPGSGIKMLMVVIYGLLKKLRSVNQELAFERKTDIEQDDIDSLVDDLLRSEE